MKLMKKILAIVCTFVMIISMATGVNAVDESSTTPTPGSITVANVKAGETYKVYKILTLDSYDKDKNAYSYIRNAEPDKWNAFVDTAQAQNFLVSTDGYVTFKESAKDAESVRKFALTALKYAKEKKISATKEITAPAETTKETTVEFTGLPLGYYLVESTVGTACSLTTTNPNATVQDKHDVPTVDKKIISGGKKYQKNTVDFGTVVNFETTVTLKPYTQNYVLHDKMDPGFDTSSVLITNVKVVKKDKSEVELNNTYYEVINKPNDNDTFDIKFTKAFYLGFSNEIDSGEVTHIVVTYSARVSNNAPVSKPILNKTHLSYGQNSKTEESGTETYTWAIQVFKFTGDHQALAGAKFILSTDFNPTLGNAIKFSHNEGENEGEYKFDANGNAELTSPESGIIKINGIKDGTYYLKEIEAPKGYNLLRTPITVVVTAKGEIEVGGKPVNRVDVQNNKGSLLPSTGGMGTTLIYVVGSILVLASAIVLFSKKKEGSN